MTDLPGLFDDDEPPPAQQAGVSQARISDEKPTDNRGSSPCARPYDFKICGPHMTHRCRVGGGEASFSDDGGRSWFCRDHAPEGFFPTMADWPSWRP